MRACQLNTGDVIKLMSGDFKGQEFVVRDELVITALLAGKQATMRIDVVLATIGGIDFGRFSEADVDGVGFERTYEAQHEEDDGCGVERQIMYGID